MAIAIDKILLYIMVIAFVNSEFIIRSDSRKIIYYVYDKNQGSTSPVAQ